MNICNNAKNSCYGNCFYGNLCAYRIDMEQEDECPMQAEDVDFFDANPDALYMKSSVSNINEDIMAEDMWYPPEEENWY